MVVIQDHFYNKNRNEEPNSDMNATIKKIEFYLKGFGYMDLSDFKSTVFKIFYTPNSTILLSMSISLGLVREFIENALGLDFLVVCVFALLIIAEWYTGIKADVFRRKRKFKSRKFGRMILKIFVYLFLIAILNLLASRTTHLSFDGFELNPFRAVYYIVFVSIILQLLISYLENLGALGYSEAKNLTGIVLRKYNKWFEFDGDKDSDTEFEEHNNNENEGI